MPEIATPKPNVDTPEVGQSEQPMAIAPENAAPQVEAKPIGQRAKEMLQRIWSRTTNQNLNPDAALQGIVAVPVEQPGTINTQSVDEITTPRQEQTTANETSKIGEPQEETNLANHGSLLSPESARRLQVREFSKSTPEGQKTRQQTAQTILQQRRSRNETQTKINERTQVKESVAVAPERLKQKENETQQEILALQAEIRNRTGSWVGRVKEFFSRETKYERLDMEFKLEELQRELPNQRYNATMAEQELPQTLKKLDDELRWLTEQKQAAQIKTQEELQRFYEKYGKEFDIEQRRIQFDKDRARNLAELEVYRKEHGTVQAVSERLNAYVVHGFLLRPGGQNSPLPNHASWKEKLIVEVSEKFPISGSTIKEGTAQVGMWGPIGVFIGEGSVDDAYGGDVQSYIDTRTGEKKAGDTPAESIQQYEEHLMRADSRHGKQGNNELILGDNPRSVGFYINLDQYSRGYDAHFSKKGLYGVEIRGATDSYGRPLNRILYNEMFEAAQLVGLPTFAIKDGAAYQASLNDQGELVMGKAFSPKEIAALKPEIPAENQPKVKEIVGRFTKPNGRSITSVTT